MIEAAPNQHEQRIVVIGGGHGTAAIFPAVAEMTPYATAVIGMSDSGGSTGELRQAYNLPAMGDAANVITASSQNAAVRAMNGSRYSSGPFAGHTPKNVMLTLLMLEHGVRGGIQEFATMFQAPGRYEPVTEETHELVLEDGPGNIIKGEGVIDTHVVQSPEPWISHEPPVNITAPVGLTVREANRILYASGSPFTSQLAALCIGGMREALRASQAEKILVANLTNEAHDTPDWHVVDYVKLLLRHEIPVDTVLYNTATELVEATGKQPVSIDPERFNELPQVRFIGAPLVKAASEHDRMMHEAGAITRQLRADVDKLAA